MTKTKNAKSFFLTTFMVMLAGAVAHAAPTATSTDLGAKVLAKVRASGIPEKELSLYITEGSSADLSVILDVNSTGKLIPASISKVATASAVLDAFPPGTKFKTQLWIRGNVEKGRLKGNLTLKGGGDPSFVSENLWFLVNHFVRTGITAIEGDILVDDTAFDAVRFDSSREDARVDRAYDAPVGAMSFNWNSVNVFVRPGENGGSANVFLDPQNDYTRLVNKVKTQGGAGQSVSVSRKVDSDQRETFTVSGTIGVNAKEVVIFKNIQNPDMWAGENLKAFLAQRGISLKGTVRRGILPAGSTLAAESESKPVELIVADMNKFSNNYVAEMLTKNLAAKEQTPATLRKGVELINAHLRKIGLEEKEYTFLNPSGLTRDNRFSARGMWKVLHHLRDDFRVQPEFLTSLPIAGIDGTLKRRMGGTSAERWVRAKTGLLTGVTALSGYAAKEDGRVFTFVFVHNGTRDESRLRRLFDDWLVALID